MPKSAVQWIKTSHQAIEEVVPEHFVVVSSAPLSTPDFVAEQWRLPPLEHPEIALTGYSLSLLLNPTSRLDVYEKGRWQQNQIYAGNIGLFDAGQSRRLRFPTGLHNVFIELAPTFVQQALREDFNVTLLEVASSYTLHDPQLERLSLAINAELESGNLHGRLFIDSLATALAIYLARTYAVRGREQPLRLAKLPTVSLQRAIDYLQAHLAEDVSLAALAEELAFSPYHFARLFKQATGLAPHQYLIQQRIERAKVLLQTSELSILDIALAVGYTSQSHFTTLFKKLTGLTPTKYRTLHSNE